MREIARRVGRDPGTISRELRRNAATAVGRLEYRALVAQWKAQPAAKRPKAAQLAVPTTALRQYVQDRLAGSIRSPDGRIVVGPEPPTWKGLNKPHRQDRRWVTAWSPEQISHRLKVDFPDDESMRISHEAIYQSLFIQGRGALKRELVTSLRTGRALRRPRLEYGTGRKGMSPRMSYSPNVPAEAADRAVPGHWEGDLIIGTGRSAIGTIVERKSRSTLLVHLPRLEGYGEILPVEERSRVGRVWRCRDERRAERVNDEALQNSSARHSPGTAARSSPRTLSSRSIRERRCSSPTPTRPGSGRRTRTPTGCWSGPRKLDSESKSYGLGRACWRYSLGLR